MVQGGVARASQHHATHACICQCKQGAGCSACMAVQHFYPRPLGWGGMGNGLPQGAAWGGCNCGAVCAAFRRLPASAGAQPAHLAFFHIAQRACIAAAKRIKAVGVNFLHRVCGMDAASTHSQHAAGLRLACQSNGIGQILRAIAQAGGGGAHGASQYNGLVLPASGIGGAVQRQLQEKGGFFQRIGAVGDNYAAHIGLRQMLGALRGQLLPHGKVHVFAVNLCDLGGLQHIALK